MFFNQQIGKIIVKKINKISNCIVCGGGCFENFYTGLLKCQDCGYVFADLHLTDEEFFELYRRNYFFGNEYCDYIAYKKVLQKNFKLRLRVLMNFIDPLRHKNLLEIGSAYGFFLEIAKATPA